MSSSLRKVARGEPLRIRADTWNTFIDVAQAHRQRELSQGVDAGGVQARAGIVTVRNASGSHQDRFAVMGISGLVIAPADNELEFQSRPAFDVVTPTDDHVDRFLVLVEPIAAGRLGKALISGVTPVKINVVDESHTTAGAKDGESGHLDSGPGLARILWKDAGTGVQWAVVQFPVGGSGGGLKLARITGKAGTEPPYLYTGVEVEHDGSASFEPGNFNTVSGGDDLSWKLVNAQEIGPGGNGVSPLHVDSIVVYTPMGSRFMCTASHYRGTY